MTEHTLVLDRRIDEEHRRLLDGIKVEPNKTRREKMEQRFGIVTTTNHTFISNIACNIGLSWPQCWQHLFKGLFYILLNLFERSLSPIARFELCQLVSDAPLFPGERRFPSYKHILTFGHQRLLRLALRFPFVINGYALLLVLRPGVAHINNTYTNILIIILNCNCILTLLH